jgi:DNA-binding NtrC family response regulator
VSRKRELNDNNCKGRGEIGLPPEVEMLIEVVKEMMLEKSAHLEEANRIFSKKLVLLILRTTRGDKRKTATLLGIDRKTLSKYIG